MMPDSGWTPRVVGARLGLTTAGTVQQFFGMLTPSMASRDEDPATAFQIPVSGDAIGEDTTYALTLVECSPVATAGVASAARFPAVGSEALSARETGPLRVQLVPLVVGGKMPDLSQSALETYRKRLFAVYPDTAVEFTVDEPLTSSSTSMCSLLSSVSSRRSADKTSVDLYYYGRI